jgi:putative spermidine/putrescine transport system permease protein
VGQLPDVAPHRDGVVSHPGTAARRLRAAGSGLFAAVLAVFVAGPLVWLGIRAFSGTWRYPALLPSTWTLQWWRQVFADSTMFDAIKLSLTLTPVVTVVSMAVCLPAAYAFARLDFPGRQVFLIAMFAANAFPRTGLFIAMASLFYALNIMSTFTGLVVVQLIGTIVFMTWIPSAAFAAVPRSPEEAARDAGAGPLRVFTRVTLPLAAPGIGVAVILSFLAAFDEAQGTYFVGAPNYVTMPTVMYTLVQHYPDQVSAVFSIMLSVPSVLLMLAVRRHVMGGALAEGFQLR